MNKFNGLIREKYINPSKVISLSFTHGTFEGLGAKVGSVARAAETGLVLVGSVAARVADAGLAVLLG